MHRYCCCSLWRHTTHWRSSEVIERRLLRTILDVYSISPFLRHINITLRYHVCMEKHSLTKWLGNIEAIRSMGGRSVRVCRLCWMYTLHCGNSNSSQTTHDTRTKLLKHLNFPWTEKGSNQKAVSMKCRHGPTVGHQPRMSKPIAIDRIHWGSLSTCASVAVARMYTTHLGYSEVASDDTWHQLIIQILTV